MNVVRVEVSAEYDARGSRVAMLDALEGPPSPCLIVSMPLGAPCNSTSKPHVSRHKPIIRWTSATDIAEPGLASSRAASGDERRDPPG